MVSCGLQLATDTGGVHGRRSFELEALSHP